MYIPTVAMYKIYRNALGHQITHVVYFTSILIAFRNKKKQLSFFIVKGDYIQYLWAFLYTPKNFLLSRFVFLRSTVIWSIFKRIHRIWKRQNCLLRVVKKCIVFEFKILQLYLGVNQGRLFLRTLVEYLILLDFFGHLTICVYLFVKNKSVK